MGQASGGTMLRSKIKKGSSSMAVSQADTIATTLRARIRNGTWSVDFQLPPERDLAEEFGVSRNTLRRALKPLFDERLISREVGRGTFVTQVGVRLGNAYLAQLTVAPIEDLAECLMTLEPQAAGLAALRADAEDLAHLARLNEATERALHPQQRRQYSFKFRRALATASQNEALAALINICLTHCEASHKFDEVQAHDQRGGKVPDPMAGHRRRLMGAVQSRSSEAAHRAMLAYLMNGPMHGQIQQTGLRASPFFPAQSMAQQAPEKITA